jgi:hypothetical protein
MNVPAGQGSVVFARPLPDTERDHIRVLLIVNAQAEADIHDRLRDDPWARPHRLDTVSVGPWGVIVGGNHPRPYPAATQPVPQCQLHAG